MGQDANVIQCIEVEVSSNRQDGAGSHDPNAAGLKETLRKKVEGSSVAAVGSIQNSNFVV